MVFLTAGLLVVSARLAYGGEPVPVQTIVVAPGDSVWSIAQTHYDGDPRPRVDQIIRINHLGSPVVVPGETLQIPRA